MKTLAILLMILTVLMMGGFALFYLLGFAMSFDAPGSDKDPGAWGMRLLMLAPMFVFLVLLILSWQAFAAGHYKKSVLLGLVTPGVCASLYLWMMWTSMAALKQYKDEIDEAKELAAKYPTERYTRTGPLGTDTIIVWSTGLVAYRLHVEGMTNTWNGPLGVLDENRKVMTYDRRPDTRIAIEELYHFMDEEKRIFTNVYGVQ
jgi:hypothetical protein